jgi:hypothetical protein
MQRSKDRQGEASMTNSAKPSKQASLATGAGILMAGATLMILLGVVFQLAELGYGEIIPGCTWLLSLLADSLWRVVSIHMNIPSLHTILVYWPLLLVGLGCSTLLALRAGNQQLASSSVRTGSRYGE